MYIRRVYLNIIAITLVLALVISGGIILHKEWRSGYVVLGQPSPPGINLATYYLENAWDLVFRPLVAGRRDGLERVRLYIPEQHISALQKDLPSRIKDWQRGYILYPGGNLERIKVRHRGDNPSNWAYGKKSWRLKTRKNRLISGTRVFNYVTPRQSNMLGNYLAYRIARDAGILTPRARMVELFINDKSYGAFTEVEHLDESFLRNNRIMPVNLYKGEQDNIEQRIYVNNNLFDNPALWSKTAVFNQLPEGDTDDLAFVLDLVRRAETSETAFAALKHVARFSEWARFSAYQTLIQSWHNNASHNMRLVSDPWRGTITPVSHDTLTNFRKDVPPSLEHTTHALLDLYGQSSEFLSEKYRILMELLDGRLLAKTAQHVQDLLPALKATYSRERYRTQQVYITGIARSLATESGMQSEWEHLIENMRLMETALKTRLTSPPKVSWRSEWGSVAVVVDGPIPVNNVTLKFSSGASRPEKIAWDSDGNGELSSGDLPIPFRRLDGGVVLESSWLANRVTTRLGTSANSVEMIKVVPTLFRLVADVPLMVERVEAANALTGKIITLSAATGGATPLRTNKPVVRERRQPVELWPKNPTITGIRIVDHPVRIEAGTTIRMMPGASLVFRAPVTVAGTATNPVRFVSAIPGKPWGAVVLHGPGVRGSRFSNMMVETGSGAVIGHVRYTGMVSVHEGEDIEFNKVTFRRNSNFDDMVHVVYSQNIRFRNCDFEGAVADALDVDISEVRITNCRISRSGNDAIDLMSSRALIEDSLLRTSGDKGVSVGEGSNALILNSRIQQNQIGVAVKDASSTLVVNSDLVGNREQIAAFRKNWRYSSGGRVVLDKSFVTTLKTKINAGKKSRIRIFDSTVAPLLGDQVDRIELDALSKKGSGRQAFSPKFSPQVEAALDKWRVAGQPRLRGVVP